MIMTYQICEWNSELSEQVTRDATPQEAANIDAQRAAGAQPFVPAEISRRQAFAALYKRVPRIMQADIEAAITAHLTGDAQFLALNDVRESQVFERGWPLVASIGALMGLSSADMDALFIAGAAL